MSVPVTEGNVTFTKGSVPSPLVSVPVTEGNIAFTKGSVPVTEGNVTLTGGSVPVTGGNVALTGGNVPFPLVSVYKNSQFGGWICRKNSATRYKQWL